MREDSPSFAIHGIDRQLPSIMLPIIGVSSGSGSVGGFSGGSSGDGSSGEGTGSMGRGYARSSGMPELLPEPPHAVNVAIRIARINGPDWPVFIVADSLSLVRVGPGRYECKNQFISTL